MDLVFNNQKVIRKIFNIFSFYYSLVAPMNLLQKYKKKKKTSTIEWVKQETVIVHHLLIKKIKEMIPFIIQK